MDYRWILEVFGFQFIKMLNTQPTIIFFSQITQTLKFAFQNTDSNPVGFYFETSTVREGSIAPNTTVEFEEQIEAGENVIAYATDNFIIHSVFSGVTNVTRAQILLPNINVDNLELRKSKLDLAIQYLAVNVTTANLSNFITTNRNSMTDYERGLDTLQAVITASASAYLIAQRKTDLINILN
mgnify:CR=1 FL=1